MYHKKTTFFVLIFDISPCVFTQISLGRACWMWHWIPHLMSTLSALLPQKQEIPEKMWWWCHHHVFLGISCFWSSRVRQKYVVWLLHILHPTSAPARNLSKNTGRFVENTNKKVVFFFIPPKLINIILLF